MGDGDLGPMGEFERRIGRGRRGKGKRRGNYRAETVCYNTVIQNPQNSKMNSSDQPARQSGGHHNQAVVLREGDWVCYHCNNLNFSFRKKCNRCKNQTKEQNEQIHSLYHLAALAYEGANLQEDCGLQECLSPASPDSLCILNPQRPGQSKSYSPSEMQQACSPCHSGELGWQLFFSSDQEIWEQNSLSDSSAEYEQEDVEVDYHIQQMVTKLII